ncbi:MAG: hypothetical protein U5J95_02910 [Balneolaceae bacterium]|nr:hypothetical protein [Balneolaceae bacterium]
MKAAEAMDMIEAAEAMLKANKNDIEEEQLSKMKDQTKAVKDSVQKLMDHVFGKEDDRQGITDSPERSVTSYLYSPYRHIGSSLGAPAETEKTLIGLAREKSNEAIGMINDFFAEDWPAYVEMMESVQLSPFKTFDKVEMK